MLSRRSVLAGAVATPAVAHAQAKGEAPTPPTLDELLEDPVVLDVALSPNGQQLAVLREERKDGKRFAYALLTAANGDETTKPSACKLGDVEVNAVEWANDERLLVWMTFRKDKRGQPYGMWFYDTFVPIPMRRVLSVGVDGSSPVVLFAADKAIQKNDFDVSRVVDYMPDHPNLVMMQVFDPRREVWALHTVDVYTGAATPLEYGVSKTDFWFTQRGVPMLRMDSNMRGTTAWLYGRAPGEKEWKLIRKSRLDENKKLPDFDVVGVTPEAGVFYVCMRGEGQDTKVVRTFDIRTMSFGANVAEQAGHDLEDVFVDEDGKLVAASYVDERQNYRFLDANLTAHFKGINSYFESGANVRLYDIDKAHAEMILKVTGPKEAGIFVIYHRAKRALEVLGTAQPSLKAERLAGMEVLSIKTRDGAQIGAYLTTPINAPKGPLPMVVMPHGGPESRDSQDFDPIVQALAARGWLVLQPNFRGSGGFGKAFADMGHKQWGGRMQDDIDDAVAQVVASGRADPKRLAIMGMSFGGFAAMSAAVRRPELYKAVVAGAGVYDLPEFLAWVRKDDGADSPAYVYWRASIGDPGEDAAVLAKDSPVQHVDQVKAPLLLFHGTEDDIVDVKQSRILTKALKAAGKPYDYFELKGEGHGDFSKENWKLVLQRSGDFITKAFA